MSVPLYHGGVRGLHRGGVLLPPSKTGAPSQADFGNGVVRRDRVYVVTDSEQATMFALFAPPDGLGDLYEVEALGVLETDPDYHGPGGSYAVPMARVIRVVQRRVSEYRGLSLVEAMDAIRSAA